MTEYPITKCPSTGTPFPFVYGIRKTKGVLLSHLHGSFSNCHVKPLKDWSGFLSSSFPILFPSPLNQNRNPSGWFNLYIVGRFCFRISQGWGHGFFQFRRNNFNRVRLRTQIVVDKTEIEGIRVMNALCNLRQNIMLIRCQNLFIVSTCNAWGKRIRPALLWVERRIECYFVSDSS